MFFLDSAPVTASYNIVGIVAGLFGLIALAASGFFIARSAMVKATIATQDQYIKAIKEENDHYSHTVASLTSKVVQLESEIGLLKDMVTSKNEVASVLAQVEEINKKIFSRHEELLAALKKS